MAIKLEDAKKKEIAGYLSTLVAIVNQNQADLKLLVDEHWMRHNGRYSAKKDKSFPWKNSADIQTGIIQYSDSALEARFSSALNSIKFVSIVSNVSKESQESAKRAEGWLNNSWQHKTNVRDTLLDTFQYSVVEGQFFLKIVPKPNIKKRKRFQYREEIVNVVNKIKKYLSGDNGELATTTETIDDFIAAKWECVPRLKMGFDNSKGNLRDSGFAYNYFTKSPAELMDLWKKEKWYGIGEILKSRQPNETPKAKADNISNNPEDQTKNDYQGYAQTLTTDLEFIEFWLCYNLGTVDAPDYKDMQFVFYPETGTLVYHDENKAFDGRKPYVSRPFYRVAGKIDGQGMPQRLAYLNDTVDLLIDQAMDNNTLSNTITGTVIPQPGMDIDKMQMQPGKFIPVKAHDNVKQFQFVNRLGDIQVLLNTIMAMVERKSLVSDYTLGRESNVNRKPTARGTEMLLQEYGLNLDPLMQNLQQGLKEAVKQTLQCAYEFMPNEGIRYSYKTGKDDEGNDKYETGVLKREDLEYLEDWDIGVLHGAVDVMVNAEKQSAQMMLQAFGGDQSGEIDTFYVKKWFVETFAPRKAQDIIKTDKEIQASKMLKQKAMQLQQAEQMMQVKAQQMAQQEQQLSQMMVAEKAKAEEKRFLEELNKQNLSPEEKAVRLALFRKQYMMREVAAMNGVNPDEMVGQGQQPQEAMQ